LKVLQGSPQEPSLLFDRLTIHVTEFFRDPEVYQAMKKKVLPAFSNVPGLKLRVWCAGCSTGEEPYSVGMLLEEWSITQPGFAYDIFATDIDAPSVRTAGNGEYPVESLKKLSKAQTTRWFYVDGSRARISPDLKRQVRFRVHDLLGDWPSAFSGFHVILCRNMLIYLTSTQQQKVYENFARALAPGGYLVLGLTETLMGPSRKYFQCVDIRHRIYQALDEPGGFRELEQEKEARHG
jgi:chemotaxis methyl-accepting protein methylase